MLLRVLHKSTIFVAKWSLWLLAGTAEADAVFGFSEEGVAKRTDGTDAEVG